MKKGDKIIAKNNKKMIEDDTLKRYNKGDHYLLKDKSYNFIRFGFNNEYIIKSEIANEHWINKTQFYTIKELRKLKLEQLKKRVIK